MYRSLAVLAVSLIGLALVASPAVSSPNPDKDQKDSKKDSAKDEKTLKGTACCAKCELKDKDFPKCQTVLIVKEDGKEVKYYFDKDSEKKHHSDYCKGKTDITVKGKVTEKDGKKWVAVSSVEKKKT
jgi:hypothetical protein